MTIVAPSHLAIQNTARDRPAADLLGETRRLDIVLDDEGDEDPLAELLIELDLPSDAEDKLVNLGGASASSAANLARNKALVTQALQRVLAFIGSDAEAPTSVIEDSTLYPSTNTLQTNAHAHAFVGHPFYVRKKTRKLVAFRSLPQWHDLDVGGALYAAFSYLQSLGSVYAFSLELDDATRALALAKGSSWLRARLVRRLDQCLGRAVPFLLAAELKTSNGDRLHFHGVVVVSPNEIPVALQALALAGGSSWTPKRGGERQAYVSKKDGAYRVADAGWIGYLTKHAAHTAKHLGGPIIAMPLSVREGARQSFEDWRAQETAREARGEGQGTIESPAPANAEDRAGESLRPVLGRLSAILRASTGPNAINLSALPSRRRRGLPHARCELFRLHVGDPLRLHIKTIEKVDRQHFQRVGFFRRVGIDVVRSVVPVNDRHVGEFDDLIVKNLQLPKRGDSHAKRFSGVSACEARIGGEEELRRYIDCLAEHGASGVVHAKASGFGGLLEEITHSLGHGVSEGWHARDQRRRPLLDEDGAEFDIALSLEGVHTWLASEDQATIAMSALNKDIRVQTVIRY